MFMIKFIFATQPFYTGEMVIILSFRGTHGIASLIYIVKLNAGSLQANTDRKEHDIKQHFSL